MKVIISSKNPVKINATLEGFKQMFPNEVFEIIDISVDSGVSAQPKSDSETFQGALNRVENAKGDSPEADYWVGIEGGIEDKEKIGIETFAWVVIKDKDGRIGKGRTGSFFLPASFAKLIKEGKELGEASDIIFQQINSKQKHGTIGNLTGNAVDRTKYYQEAVIFALIPFKNKDLYL